MRLLVGLVTEQWKPVVGYEGLYEVSDHGRVRSLDRTVSYSKEWNRRLSGRVLKSPLSVNGGYPQVRLTKNNRGSTKSIHRLVLEAFVGPCPEGMQACHYDDDPTNNRLENLRWGTRSHNERDKLRNGNHNNAKKTHCPQGHEYTPENTYLYRGRRDCRICKLERNRKSQLKAMDDS